MTRRRSLAALAAAALAPSALAAAQDRPSGGAPGEARHGSRRGSGETAGKLRPLPPELERLTPMEGSFTTTVKTWSDPTVPPAVTQGTATLRLMLGRQYLQEDWMGEDADGPLHGIGYTGYDAVRKQYVAAWLDNHGTGIGRASGKDSSPGKEIRLTGEASNPGSGKVEKLLLVRTLTDPDQHRLEVFRSGKDGKQIRSMEVTYQRVK